MVSAASNVHDRLWMRPLVLVVVLVGCSASHHAGPDAGPDGADAAVDGGGSGSDPGIAPTDVRVVVRDGFAPIAGVRVVFDAADGTRTELVTDTTGAATTTMAMGGNVTVIRTYPAASTQQYPEIYSYLAVKPGEILHVGHVVDTITPPTPITVIVPSVARGTVKVVSPCGSGQGTAPNIAVSVRACPPNVTFYVADGAQEGFAAKVPYATSIDFSQQILNGFLSTTMLTYNVTPDLASVTAEARAMDGTHAVYSTGVKRVDQASTQLNIPDLRLVVDELVIGTRVATAGGTQIVASRSVWKPMSVSVDASGAVLPYLRQPATVTPTTISWVEDGTSTVDAVLATVDVKRANPATPADARYRRIVIAPHGGMSLDLPQLTGADATYNPGAGDQVTGAVGLVGASAGYDALRPWAFGVSSIIEATTVDNTVTVSFATNSQPTL